MTTSFRDWPWPLQALVYVVLGVAIVVAGFYTPGSPVRNRRVDLDAAQARKQPLQDEVNTLRDFERQRGQLQGEMEALQKQLATLQAIVPEDKQVDQFILMIQGAASSSDVSIRRLATKTIVPREFHYEMPFEVEADGPYYAVLDFFGKLGRLSRIINVGDLAITGIGDESNRKEHMTRNTTVKGTFTVTTFFTRGAEEQLASMPAAKR
jgi:type IV pilus assembly protein PilO